MTPQPPVVATWSRIGCNNSIDPKLSRIDVVQAVVAHRLKLAAAARLPFISPGMNLYFRLSS